MSLLLRNRNKPHQMLTESGVHSSLRGIYMRSRITRAASHGDVLESCVVKMSEFVENKRGGMREVQKAKSPKY